MKSEGPESEKAQAGLGHCCPRALRHILSGMSLQYFNGTNCTSVILYNDDIMVSMLRKENLLRGRKYCTSVTNKSFIVNTLYVGQMLNTYHALDKFSRRQTDDNCLIFHRK